MVMMIGKTYLLLVLSENLEEDITETKAEYLQQNDSKEYKEQDWVAFMSQPYWVEVEVELRLILRLGWFEVGLTLGLIWD